MTKEAELLLMDLLIGIVDCPAVYSQAKADLIMKLISAISKGDKK